MTWWNESSPLRQLEEGVELSVRVQPRASRNRFAGTMAGALKICLTAPPVDGEANRALQHFLAKILGVSPAAVSIIRGHQGRNKTVLVAGVTTDQVIQKLRDL